MPLPIKIKILRHILHQNTTPLFNLYSIYSPPPFPSGFFFSLFYHTFESHNFDTLKLIAFLFAIMLHLHSSIDSQHHPSESLPLEKSKHRFTLNLPSVHNARMNRP